MEWTPWPSSCRSAFIDGRHLLRTGIAGLARSLTSFCNSRPNFFEPSLGSTLSWNCSSDLFTDKSFGFIQRDIYQLFRFNGM
jgi:hypothetical protein